MKDPYIFKINELLKMLSRQDIIYIYAYIKEYFGIQDN